MTSPAVPRRTFLGYLAGMVPIGPLAGCGGGDASSTDAAPLATTPEPPGIAPLVTFVAFTTDTGPAGITSPDQDLNALALGPDRFGVDRRCRKFASASSRALVRNLPPIGEADFAISLWASTTTRDAMRLLALSGPAGRALTLDIDSRGDVSASRAGDDRPATTASPAASMSDGSWHHVLVQRVSGNIALFVDGRRRGDGARADATPAFTQLQVGGDHEWPLTASIDQVRLYNRTFSDAEVTAMVYAWARLKPTTRGDSVAAYYPFHGNARNETGRGFDGRLFNVVPARNRFGAEAGAYRFNGVDSCIELDDSFDASSGDFAIMLWVRSTDRSRMTALSIGGGANDLALVFNDGYALRLVVDAGDAPLAFGATGELADGNWHFVALQRSADRLELFVDHVLRATSQRPLVLYGPSSVVRIGRGSGALGQSPASWSGEIDDLQFCECAFTEQEIADFETLQFRPRDGAGALVHDDRMWLLGGWNPDDATPTNNEVWSSADGHLWSFAGNAPWPPRHTAGYLVFGGRMWVIGGDKSLGHYQNDVWSSADGVHWEFVTDQVPWADRATHYVLAFDGRMWVMGGQKLYETSGEAVAYNDVYSSADGRTWTLATQHAPWSARGLILGSAVFRGRMWVIGGGTYDVRSYNNDVWSSADGIHWELATANGPWSPRQYHSVVVFDNKLWVLAGSSEAKPSGLGDAWYSADGTTWTQLETPHWSERHATSVMAHRQGLWVVAGSAAAVYNDVWRLGYAA